ncbi:MAG: ribose-phosphate pyrophosphokinase [Alphaproteobacteria bacterium]|nr:ribose-phosphate pyrophosphokinase [Alphaproteobacteria bacterium]
MKIITGNSNKPLAMEVANFLHFPLTEAHIRRFSDNEVFVEILESVRGEDVFVIQPTSYPANDNLMELLVIMDALKRGSAKTVTAVIPYFGYARQDRKTGPRTPISAKLVANLITIAGANRVLTVDLHATQVQGFFDIPVDNLYVAPMFSRDILQRFDKGAVTIVSPDVGGVTRARSLAKRIDGDLAIIDKRREAAGVSEVMNVIGDVSGRVCILFDDIVDSGGTLCNAAKALMDKGAVSVYAYVTHGVLSGKGVENIQNSAIQEMVLTDTIQLTENAKNVSKIRVLPVGPVLGEAIHRIGLNESVSSLFN